MPEPVRVGADGVGGWAATILDAARRSPRVEIVRCFDVSPEATRQAAAQYACEAADSYEELVADDRVEAIVSNTPNFVHLEHGRLAAAAGKHFYVAKPITNSLAEAAQLIRACRDAGVVLAVGHQTRRHSAFRHMKELIASGAAGTILQAEANFSHAGGMSLTADRWRADREKCPACPLMQLGMHCTDTLVYLLGPAARVTGLMRHQTTPVDIDDVTAALFEFECGALGYVGSNYASPGIHTINVYGTQANLLTERYQLTIHWADGRREQPELPEVDVYLEEIEDFAGAIREGRDPEVTGEAGMAALAIVEGAIVSAREGRTVQVAQLLQASGS
jgi:predicted dehydrogenase